METNQKQELQVKLIMVLPKIRPRQKSQMHVRLPGVGADMPDGLLNSKDWRKSHKCMSAAAVWFLVVT